MSPSLPIRGQTLEEVYAAIRELDANVRRHIQDRDADAMVDGYYAENARILPPSGGELQGRVAIREMWRGLVASGMIDLVLETAQIEAAGDLAVGTGIARATVHPPGAGAVILEGRYTVVFRRQANGQWRTVVDMYTIDSERPA
jgi:uncharacterized protein (TIGR02246 family)